MSQIDQKILEGCRNGKRHAQSQLYNKFAPSMLGICLRYAKSKDEAEDMMQEGFIKIFSNIEGFRGDGSFEGWMKRIMINTAITYYKKNLKYQYHTDIDDIEEKHSSEEDQENTIEEVNIPREKLMSLIQGLPEGYRMVFNLYVFEQYSHKDIADLLGVSVNTSKSQLSKARRLLISRITEVTGTKNIVIN